MYSVLIVDDFAFDRKNMVEAIESFTDLPLRIIGVCENAYEALDAVRNFCPDILLCDVEMPGMTGIDLADALRAEGNHVRIVFCSLYDKLHYLKAAIQLNSDGYIMKPFSRQELENCLKNVMMQLLNHRAQQEELIALKQAMRENRISLIREFFSDLLLDDEMADEEMRRRARPLSLDTFPQFRLALVEINLNETFSTPLPLADSSVIPYRVYQTLKKGMAWEMPYYVVRISEKKYAVVFCFGFSESGNHSHHSTEIALSAFVQKMRELGISVTATFGQPVPLSGLRRQYEWCRRQLNYRYQYIGDPVIFKEDTASQSNRLGLDLTAAQNNLFALLGRDVESMEQEARQYADILLQGLPLCQQQMVCQYLLGSTQFMLQENSVPQESIMKAFYSVWGQVTALGHPHECHAFLQGLVIKAWELLDKQTMDGSHELISRVKHFIRDGDLKSIHLGYIAEHFSYSPNYLNHIFKSGTGETILEYITKQRIRKAKELMRSTHMRLGEIAAEIGYSHATYLSMVFKKQEGIAPKQYMERLR